MGELLDAALNCYDRMMILMSYGVRCLLLEFIEIYITDLGLKLLAQGMVKSCPKYS